MKPRFALLLVLSSILPALLAALTYSEWGSSVFTPTQLSNPSVSGTAADPDGDGLSNLFEYAFAGHPFTADSGSLMPEFIADTFTVTYRERHELTDLSIRLQGSYTLTNWITYNTVIEADRTAFSGYDEVTLLDPIPFDGARGRFLRVRVGLLPVVEPRAPTQLALTVVTPSQWNLRWTDPNTTETGYAVERRLSDNTWERLVTLGFDTGDWQHASANYQTSMIYRVVTIGINSEAVSEPISLLDTDGDGIPNAFELGSAYSGANGTYASRPDQFSSNGSGVSDGWLASNGFDLPQFDGATDTDGDSLSDYEEYLRGTDPRDPDTDSDGVSDLEDGWALHAWITALPIPEAPYLIMQLRGLGWPEDPIAEELNDIGHVLGRHEPPKLVRFDLRTRVFTQWDDVMLYKEFFFGFPTQSLSQSGAVMAQFTATLENDHAARIHPDGTYSVPLRQPFNFSYPMAISPT